MVKTETPSIDYKSPMTWKYITLLVIILGGIGTFVYMAMVPAPTSFSTAKNVTMDGYTSVITPSVTVNMSSDPAIRSINGQWYSVSNKMFINSFVVSVDIDANIDVLFIDVAKGITLTMSVFATISTGEGVILSNSTIVTMTATYYRANMTNGRLVSRFQSLPFVLVSQPFANNQEVKCDLNYTITTQMMTKQGIWYDFSTRHTLTEVLRYVAIEEQDVDNLMTSVKVVGSIGASILILGIIKRKRNAGIRVGLTQY